MTEFQENIDRLTNIQLINVIKSKDDYQEKFWELAVENAKKRGLEEKISEVLIEIEKNQREMELIQLENARKKDSLPSLYSDRSIITFSLLFTPIAGSILFYKNLKVLKVKDENIDTVIWFGIIYTAIVFVIISFLPFEKLNSLGLIVNIFGGLILTVHYGSKYYPSDLEYRNKRTIGALIIALIISFILALTIYKLLMIK